MINSTVPPDTKTTPVGSKAHIKPCYVYVLGCFTGASPRTYTGWTMDIDARLKKHNSGRGAKATRGRQWVVLHSEAFKTRGEAMQREFALKRDRATKQSLVKLYLANHSRTE